MDHDASRRATTIAIVVAVVFFMESFAAMVITTALPAMAESFGRTPVDLSIGVTAYMLTLAVGIPLSGWIAERVGPRAAFSTAIVLFTVASVACGLADGLATFTMARIAQGAAGALLIPVGRMVVLQSAAKDQLLRAIAYITWPVLAAPAIAPPVGGLLATYASWRWIFFLNVPLGIVGFLAARRVIPVTMATERRRFDVMGFVLLALSCGGLVYGLEMVSRQDAAVGPYLAMIMIAMVVGAVAVRHLRTSSVPLVDLSPMRIRTFAVPMGGGSLFRISVTATPFLLPLLFQVGFGMSAARSGLLVFSVFAGNLLIKPITTVVLRRYGFRRVLLVNGALSSASIAACALFTAHTPMWLMVVVLFAGGVFRATQATTQITLTFAEIPQGAMASASALSSLIVQLSLTMGVAVGALAVRVFEVLAPGSAGSADHFRWAFLVVAGIGLLALFDMRTLAPDDGAEVSGHRRAVAAA